LIVMSGPARGRRKRATTLRALLPCLALIAFDNRPAQAQTLTPDLLRPVRDGFLSPQDSLLRKTSDNNGIDPTDIPLDPDNNDSLRGRNTRAPSRIGQIPSYGLPAASGAADSGFDSLNRTRKKPKFYPGQARPKPPAARRFEIAAAAVDSAVRIRQQDAAAAGDGGHGGRPADAQAPQGR
jgi:hypothetical protein